MVHGWPVTISLYKSLSMAYNIGVMKANTKLVLVTGINGSGKSTLFKALVNGNSFSIDSETGWVAIENSGKKILVVGEYSSKVAGGADLVRNPRLFEILSKVGNRFDVILLEAQRFGYGKDFVELKNLVDSLGWEFGLGWVTCSPETSFERVNSQKNRIYGYKLATLVSRFSKLENSFNEFPNRKVKLDSENSSPEKLARNLLEFVS